MSDLEFNRHMTDGCFAMAGPVAQDTVQDIVSCYHVRNGTMHHDGSVGEIRITPKELHDLLVYAIARFGIQEAMSVRE